MTDPTIRRARPADTDRLTRIAFAAKRHWGYSEDMIRLWSDDLTVAGSYIDDHEVFVIESHDEIVAWYSIDTQDDVAMVDYCWVDPPSIGKGYGRMMLEHMRRVVRSHGDTRVQVISDPNAAGFYRRMGFRLVDHYASLPPGRMLPVLELTV